MVQNARLHPLSFSQEGSEDVGAGAICLTPARSVPDMETKCKSSHLPYQKLDSLTQKYPRQLSSQTASFASDGSQVRYSIFEGRFLVKFSHDLFFKISWVSLLY